MEIELTILEEDDLLYRFQHSKLTLPEYTPVYDIPLTLQDKESMYDFIKTINYGMNDLTKYSTNRNTNFQRFIIDIRSIFIYNFLVNSNGKRW
ncbi:MAG: hypothetical protein K9N46_03645 [Candidatus Marinimicrobia bacterium]|nr:hypothetical protein [Candidatus Neomarinimicrobiota bacterium]MCF7829656.1 hypothetical protein [Candidatus Neomarinimicrobiota bacterium]MCF7879816.1 hypothetical protein [Candidatus Neomarinimicrobiota bacterium]